MNTLDYLFLLLAWPQSAEFGHTFQIVGFRDHAASFGLDIGLTQNDIQPMLKDGIVDLDNYRRVITMMACLKYERNDHAHELHGVVDAIAGPYRSLC